ncbi:MAG: M14 family metallopeptidase [Gemmatimonadales bacterium]|nr:M14 family metallopeptidase [Gemmatimonadales bacterium]MDQ3427066.1 M14 family metallopeptidase [Gemmatimonadota bacterium]
MSEGRFHSGAALLLAALLVSPAAAQTTRPERTGFRETSSHADVLGFLDSLQRAGAEIRVGTLATSAEGRRVPYVVAARPMVAGPAEAHRSGKPIVYLQGNIHAGEVEGKEAAQMLLRDLTRGALSPLLDSLILLVAPIYNADGNERLERAEDNRPGQNGPATVGRNLSGLGLNLNRDYVKMEAPETRGAAALLLAWDPDLFIDLHTTNGSYHGYVLTFAPGLNPNASPAGDFVRDRLLPTVQDRMQRRHGQASFWYGNFRNQEPDSLIQGWETYDARPRFGTNWMGMRGRLSVLSEAYSNADFRTRILATYNFVREVLSFAAVERQAIKSLVAASDRRAPDSVTVRSVLAPGATREVVAEITRPAGAGAGGYARRRRTGVYRTLRMPVFDRFTASRREAMPSAYLLPQRLGYLVALLRRQGVAVERLHRPWQGRAERFTVDSLAAGPLFEGHRTVAIEGRWGAPRPVVAGPGWYLVRTSQPLGTFAAYLLEPASEDGVVTWNLLDRELEVGADYPIVRARSAVEAAATTVP